MFRTPPPPAKWVDTPCYKVSGAEAAQGFRKEQLNVPCDEEQGLGFRV